MPLLAGDGKADGLVDVPVHGTGLIVVPDPKLLVVVELAAVRKLLGIDDDIGEELGADVDALRGALGDLAHDDFALEGAENYEAKLGCWVEDGRWVCQPCDDPARKGGREYVKRR